MMSVVFKERSVPVNTGFKFEILIISIMLQGRHTISKCMQLTTHQPSVIVIDNFYQDPHAVKQLAIDSEYDLPGMHGSKRANWAGARSLTNYHPANLSQRVSQLLGKQVRALPKKDHGYFRYALADDQPATFLHCDVEFDAQGYSTIDYSLVVYLTESTPATDSYGTVFFRHKQLGCNTATLENSSLTAPDQDKPSVWDIDSVVGFAWNRAVLFNSALFHTAGAGFGTSKEDARCVQVFYFYNLENS